MEPFQVEKRYRIFELKITICRITKIEDLSRDLFIILKMLNLFSFNHHIID